jgi:hypothetical protein
VISPDSAHFRTLVSAIPGLRCPTKGHETVLTRLLPYLLLGLFLPSVTFAQEYTDAEKWRMQHGNVPYQPPTTPDMKVTLDENSGNLYRTRRNFDGTIDMYGSNSSSGSRWEQHYDPLNNLNGDGGKMEPFGQRTLFNPRRRPQTSAPTRTATMSASCQTPKHCRRHLSCRDQ